ncbi:RagB/SusD family nutrient uptake outer membrane protein [uncultured Bacteroides sp.]|uniref:RagB/SusD family nutrient uptake outer membrane protein n=1 Tax=uncultured Bacteroides sp. TaxID=162156 RepID=UPI002AA7BD62|nr:RagB/SusD family nutrient uptake outer membrane protein [uncultured Bacteroides sp.]
MKIKNKWIMTVVAGMTLSAFISCVDEVKFGNAFLDKAPGGSVTIDTVFNNAEYTRQYLTSLYSYQYYGLPYYNGSGDFPEVNNPYVGKCEVLSDCWQTSWSGCAMYSQYYNGSHTSGYGVRSDKWHYTTNRVWQAVRAGWLLVENIDGVPGLTDTEKATMKAEAKCIIAARYFDTFRHYGGIPIIKASFSGTDASYDMPRGSVEETVNFMVGLLDEAASNLPWNFDASEASNEEGHWTKAAAMALKCRILLFAASPLFNAAEPYHPDGANIPAVWYGGYKPELWEQCKNACTDFFQELTKNGHYQLVQATGTRPEDYRLAYRKGYATMGSSEILLSTRVITTDAFKSSYYIWHNWGDPLMSVQRLCYCPTQEYVEMFPWADGKPFDWEKAKSEGKLDQMFLTGTVGKGNIALTRDPRLYEEAIVNGQQKTLDWTSGNMSGQSFELWVGGTDAQLTPETQSGAYGTGYAPIKFLMGDDMLRQYTEWPYLRLSEIYLTYAEALLQTGDLPNAIKQVNVVRSRVGLGGLVECNPDKNLTTDKEALLQEILRERTCELGMEDCRFFDMIRYKMKDRFEKQLHGLRIYRLDTAGNRIKTAWYNGDRTSGAEMPTHFDYEIFEISGPTRYWWTNGFDPKWYLSPFPLTEVNKGYGLVQNPGW